MIAARKRAGLTQQQLAKRLKRPQSFVAKYEGGERRLDVVEFITIARAIGADPLRILKSLVNRAGLPSRLPCNCSMMIAHSDDCDQSFQRIATSVTRVRDGTVG